MPLPYLASALLGRQPRIRHRFFTRQGGVSVGEFAALNCSPFSADAAAAVTENRARVCRALGASALFSLRQQHGCQVHLVDAASTAAQCRLGDALLTRQRGVLLGVLGADCAPVLLAEPTAGIVAAAHAGWRGALHGVTDAVIDAILEQGGQATRIVCAIGPAIQCASYQVDAAFLAQFQAHGQLDAAHYFVPGRADSLYFDLPRYIEHRLRQRGVAAVDRLPEDTYADATRFFSYRRSCHLNQPQYGRQISVIGME